MIQPAFRSESGTSPLTGLPIFWLLQTTFDDLFPFLTSYIVPRTHLAIPICKLNLCRFYYRIPSNISQSCMVYYILWLFMIVRTIYLSLILFKNQIMLLKFLYPRLPSTLSLWVSKEWKEWPLEMNVGDGICLSQFWLDFTIIENIHIFCKTE